jgi:molybdopterin converting factor small subunit
MHEHDGEPLSYVAVVKLDPVYGCSRHVRPPGILGASGFNARTPRVYHRSACTIGSPSHGRAALPYTNHVNVHVELQSYLEQYSPDGGGRFDYSLPDGATVDDLVHKLMIPDDLASVISVGGANSDRTHLLKDGDRVVIIPPLAGG